MATGAGLSGLMTAVLPLVGLISVLAARRKRRMGITTPEDAEFERRQAERAEMERRMASYLSQNRPAGHAGAYDTSDEQEIRR